MIGLTILIILATIIVIFLRWQNRKSIKQTELKIKANKILLNLSEMLNCSEIKIIDPPKEYDREIFFPEDPINNPSIYSDNYEDCGSPKVFSSLSELEKEAKKIYQMPEKYKNSLGGANLMVFSSQAAKEKLNSNEYKLYSPLFFGFYRNQSSKSLFNLVKTGKVAIKPFSVHSPATTTLTNNTNQTLNINIPKGTILEGTNENQAPIQTTEDYNITIQPHNTITAQLEHKPLNFMDEYLKILELKLEFERKGYVYGFYGDYLSMRYNCSGEYKLTCFFNPELKEEIVQKHLPDSSELCSIHQSCEMLKTDFKDKKVKRMCIAKIPLKNMEQKEGEDFKYAIHEGVVIEFESGECIVVEKFGSDSSTSISHRERIDPRGQIETHKCKVSGNDVYVHDEIYEIMQDSQWRNIDSVLTGAEIYDRIQSSPKYEATTTNCQHFARTTFPEANFSPQKAQGTKLVTKVTKEVINHTGYCAKDLYKQLQIKEPVKDPRLTMGRFGYYRKGQRF